MEDARLEAHFFLESFGGLSESEFQSKLASRIAGMPLAYLEGKKGFWKHEFSVSPAVLIPRPETEVLVEWGADILTTLENASELEVWDFGTGSGCILLSLLADFPGALGRGWDISAAALEIALANSQLMELEERSVWGVSDWWVNTPPCSAQLVIANPPYIMPGESVDFAVEKFEPQLALFTPVASPLEPYQKITAGFADAAPAGSCLLFEIGAGRLGEVTALGKTFGLEELGSRLDLAGIPRAVGFKKPGLG
jgi:release factor glutamine methyltransferase